MRILYNRYIPQDIVYDRVSDAQAKAETDSGSFFDFSRMASGGGHEKNAGGMLSGILKCLGFSDIDFGDILLVLIFILLLSEGENFELTVILGLLLLADFAGAEELL